MLQAVKHQLWFWKRLFERFFEHRGVSSAAALTYTTLFAVVPLMTVTFSVLSAIPFFHGMGGQIQSFIFSNFIPSAGATVQEYLQGFSMQARHLTWVGILVLTVTAYLMLLNIEQAFNVIWHIRRSRRGVSSFLLYWAILSLGPLLLGAGFAISTYIASFTLFSGPHPLPGVATLIGLLPLICSGSIHPGLRNRTQYARADEACVGGRGVCGGAVRGSQAVVQCLRRHVPQL